MSVCDEPKLNAVRTIDFASVVQPDPVYRDLLQEIELLRAENQRLWEIIEEQYPGADIGEARPSDDNGQTRDVAPPSSYQLQSANGTSRDLKPEAAQPEAKLVARREAAQTDPSPPGSQPTVVELDESNQQREQVEHALREFGDELARLREELRAYIESQEPSTTWYQYDVPVEVSTTRTWSGITPRQIVRGLIWFSVFLTILLIALLSYEVASTANLF